MIIILNSCMSINQDLWDGFLWTGHKTILSSKYGEIKNQEWIQIHHCDRSSVIPTKFFKNSIYFSRIQKIRFQAYMSIYASTYNDLFTPMTKELLTKLHHLTIFSRINHAYQTHQHTLTISWKKMMSRRVCLKPGNWINLLFDLQRF